MEEHQPEQLISRRRFLVAAGASAIALPRWSFAQQQPIRIGFPTPLTSPYSIEAQDQVNGATLAVEQFNAAGGVLGRKVELLARDDQLKPGVTAQKAKELIEKDKVDFMSGALSAHVQMAVNSQTKPAKMVYISISQANAITAVPDWSPWTFHEAFSPHMTTQAGGSWAIDNLGKRICILYADYALGHDLNAGIERIAKVKGATITAKIPHVLGNPDYSSFIPKILATNADVLFINNYGKDQLNAVKDMHNFGVKKKMKIFFPLITFTGREDLGPVPYEDVYGGASFYWELARDNPSAKRFVDAFQKRFNRPPGDYAGYAYSAIRLLLDSAVKAKTIDSDKVAAVMSSATYDTYKGKQWMRKCDHQSFQDWYIVRSKPQKNQTGKYDVMDVVAKVPASENLERSCAELGHKA
jgi:branched-chain amino acid transport system substrate-binding protein